MTDILEEFKKSPYVQLLKDYFTEEITKMKDISTIKGTIEEKGKIVEGRQESEKIITKFLRGLDIKIEKKKISNQYK